VVNLQEYMMMLPPEMQQAVGNFYQAPAAPQYTTVNMPGGIRRLVDAVGGGVGGGPANAMSYNPSNPYSGINPYAYSYMDPKEGPGDRLLADLIRAQTRDYQTRFAPIENMLAASITRTGTTFLPQDLERTRGAITGAAQNVQGMSNRAANRLGVQGAQMDQNNTTSTLVGGLNETRARDSDRRLQLLTGGLSGITQSARNIGQ
jgi:hypothetical protein